MKREERGEREYQGLIGGAAAESLADIHEMAPDMYEALVAGAFGGTLANAALERAARELGTVAMLAAAGGLEPQLATHFRAALRLSVAPSELRALCEHVSVYASFPRALNALRLLDQVLGDAGIARPAPNTHSLPIHSYARAYEWMGREYGGVARLLTARGLARSGWVPASATGRSPIEFPPNGLTRKSLIGEGKLSETRNARPMPYEEVESDSWPASSCSRSIRSSSFARLSCRNSSALVASAVVRGPIGGRCPPGKRSRKARKRFMKRDQPPVNGLLASWLCHPRAHPIEQNGSPFLTATSGRSLPQYEQRPSRGGEGSSNRRLVVQRGKKAVARHRRWNNHAPPLWVIR
jgi:alkylhydroperoxidase/carboxymuconolactone decarboxylase family protein YurZ